MNRGVMVSVSPMIAHGYMTLWRAGKAVYAGRIGDPIEDVEFDEIILNPADEERLAAAIKAKRGR